MCHGFKEAKTRPISQKVHLTAYTSNKFTVDEEKRWNELEKEEKVKTLKRKVAKK
jgi:hypothetical protein